MENIVNAQCSIQCSSVIVMQSISITQQTQHNTIQYMYQSSPTQPQPQPQHQHQKQQQQQPSSYHIGIKSTRLHQNIYNTSILSYASNCHLLVNHGQSLFVYQSTAKQLQPSAYGHHHLLPSSSNSNNNNTNNANPPNPTVSTTSYIKHTFSTKWKCIFLLTSNQTLDIISYEALLPLTSNIDLKSLRHCLDLMYFDQYSAFVVLFPHCIKIVYVEIVSNHLRSLFSNAYVFKMRETCVKVLDEGYFLQFASKIIRVGDYLLMNNSEDVKIVWHDCDRNFYEKSSDQDNQIKMISQSLFNMVSGHVQAHSKYSRKTIIHIRKICSLPQNITYILYNPQQYLLICGTNLGELKVFKINIKNIIATTSPTNKHKQISIQAKSQLTFKLSLHNNRAISCIQMYSPKIILSVGADEYVEVVSIDQMAVIERFRTSSHLTGIYFVSNASFLAVKTIEFDQFLYCFDISLDYQLLVQHNSQISHAIYKRDQCIMVLTDNSVSLLSFRKEEELNYKRKKSFIANKPNTKQEQTSPILIPSSPRSATKKHKQPKPSSSMPPLPKQSFVPPRCKSILSIQYYPYSRTLSSVQLLAAQKQQQFWLLTDQSQIYQYCITSKMEETEKITTFKITGMLQLYLFVDGYGHETKQKVVNMKFVDLVPVCFDSDIKQKMYKPNYGKVDDVRPIAFGCRTGQLLICSSLQPHKIISRVRTFGQPVAYINFCSYPDSDPSQVYRQNQQQNEQQLSMPPSHITQGKINDRNVPHRRRLAIYCSSKQIVAVMLSNYLVPQIIYKLLLPGIPFFVKQLSPDFCCVVSGHTPKILMPHPKCPSSKILIWTPSTPIHDAQITCLEHCQKITAVSGDSSGKIVIWTIKSEILGTVVISETVKIQICYFWDDRLMFGYNAKIFQMWVEKGENCMRNCLDGSTLINDEKWVAEFTQELSMTSNSVDGVAIFKQSFTQKQLLEKYKANDNSQTPIKSHRRVDMSDLVSRSEQIKNRQQKSIDDQIFQLRKSMTKLTHELKSQSPHHTIHKKQTTKPFSIGTKSKSTSKHVAVSSKFINIQRQKLGHVGSIEMNSSRIVKAKSILDQFKRAQQKQGEIQRLREKSLEADLYEFGKTKTRVSDKDKDKEKARQKNQVSLPQIKLPTSHQTIEIDHEQHVKKKKKNRNKKYQFLFHFPNTGLYTTLISKQMLE